MQEKAAKRKEIDDLKAKLAALGESRGALFPDAEYVGSEACQGCHAVDSGFEGPATGKTCDRCHETTDPQIGDDDVDATLDGACGVCHGRQKQEAANYSDVHRTAGADCMFCHTMGDVHGDGTIYRTMIEDGAIDSPIDSATNTGLSEATKEVLAGLTAREAKVLRMRFGIDMNTDHTLEEVGKQFDVTRERIRQIEAKALRKLRHPSRSDHLRTFLDE